MNPLKTKTFWKQALFVAVVFFIINIGLSLLFGAEMTTAKWLIAVAMSLGIGIVLAYLKMKQTDQQDNP